MEKEAFLALARNFASLTAEETQELELLRDRFPYSQVIRSLVTRGSQDNQLPAAKEALHLGAIYSSDRVVLKEIINAPRSARGTQASLEIIPEARLDLAPEGNTLSGDDLIHEVMTDLNRLQELKHNFEVTFEEFNKARGKEDESPALQKSPPGPATKSAGTAVQKKKLNKAENHGPPLIEPAAESLLDEIRTSREGVGPDSPKQKEQIEIIDEFIKRQPSISRPAGAPADAVDLAEKGQSLTDQLVSETLVEVLLRQGKKDKAIEVLRKLIWKFPQKKSIFAAQIEDLKT